MKKNFKYQENLKKNEEIKVFCRKAFINFYEGSIERSGKRIR